MCVVCVSHVAVCVLCALLLLLCVCVLCVLLLLLCVCVRVRLRNELSSLRQRFKEFATDASIGNSMVMASSSIDGGSASTSRMASYRAGHSTSLLHLANNAGANATYSRASETPVSVLTPSHVGHNNTARHNHGVLSTNSQQHIGVVPQSSGVGGGK